jgi:hypothetical protein
MTYECIVSGRLGAESVLCGANTDLISQKLSVSPSLGQRAASIGTEGRLHWYGGPPPLVQRSASIATEGRFHLDRGPPPLIQSTASISTEGRLHWYRGPPPLGQRAASIGTEGRFHCTECNGTTAGLGYLEVGLGCHSLTPPWAVDLFSHYQAVGCEHWTLWTVFMHKSYHVDTALLEPLLCGVFTRSQWGERGKFLY